MERVPPKLKLSERLVWRIGTGLGRLLRWSRTPPSNAVGSAIRGALAPLRRLSDPKVEIRSLDVWTDDPTSIRSVRDPFGLGLLERLREIGNKQPIGYENARNIPSRRHFLAVLHECGLEGFVCDEVSRMGVPNRLIYFYDERALADFLPANARVLRANGIPTTPRAFAEYVALHPDEDSEARAVIAKALGRRWPT